MSNVIFFISKGIYEIFIKTVDGTEKLLKSTEIIMGIKESKKNIRSV
jgi:hypothetical protein